MPPIPEYTALDGALSLWTMKLTVTNGSYISGKQAVADSTVQESDGTRPTTHVCVKLGKLP